MKIGTYYHNEDRIQVLIEKINEKTKVKFFFKEIIF